VFDKGILQPILDVNSRRRRRHPANRSRRTPLARTSGCRLTVPIIVRDMDDLEVLGSRSSRTSSGQTWAAGGRSLRV
jgi:hypothetical protein